IDQADWPSSHITLELAASGKQIAIKGYSTKSAGDTQWMKTVLLKLDIDARNDLHVKRDGQESTFDDIAKMIFVAVVSGSDFR
ncbi:MAG: hypothetical protein ABI977_16420, partial [Acidobacteriota bacterium]